MHQDKTGRFLGFLLIFQRCVYTDEQREIVRLIQAQTNSWIGITKTSGVVGGDACIKNMRIPVWILVQYRQMGANDRRILEAYPQLTATDLANAWTYAEAFPDRIA